MRRKHTARRNGWLLWAAGGTLLLIVAARIAIGLD